MQRRTCRVCLAFVFYIFLPGGSRYFYMVRSSRIYIERERRRCGGAGSRLSAKNRTGNRYPGHEAPPSLCVERVTPPLLARRVRSKHPRAVSGTVPSTASFSTSSAASTILHTPPTTTFGLDRWMHHRHGPPITKYTGTRNVPLKQNTRQSSAVFEERQGC